MFRESAGAGALLDSMTSTLFSSFIFPSSRMQLFFPKFSIPVALHMENLKYATSKLKLIYEHMDLTGISVKKTPMSVTTVG